MTLIELLTEKQLSVYQCSKYSNIPYTTLLQLVNGKSSIDNCSSGTLYKLAKALGFSMEKLYEELSDKVPQEQFSTFKSNLCHRVKEEGDVGFIIKSLENDEIRQLWRLHRYAEAFYSLGMLDYLCRVNDLPQCGDYEDLRAQKLDKPLLPLDSSMAYALGDTDSIAEAYQNAIPEFLRFNIIEGDIRDAV